jgi:hypothetical protein
MVGTVSTGAPCAKTDKRVVFPLHDVESKGSQNSSLFDSFPNSEGKRRWINGIPILESDHYNVKFLGPKDL